MASCPCEEFSSSQESQSGASEPPTVQRAAQKEFDFIELPPQDYFCPVSFDLLLEPQQTKCCGNHLSLEVTTRLQKEGKPCPMCNSEKWNADLDKYHRRKVHQVRVRCWYKQNGCGWEGDMNEFKKHANSCDKRPWECEYCGLKCTYGEGAGKHWPICPKFPLPCPNGCEVGSVERCGMEQHRSVCPLEPVACEMKEFGCSVVVPRKELATHMRESELQHLTAMTALNLRLTRQLQQDNARLDQMIAQQRQEIDQQRKKMADIMSEQKKLEAEVREKFEVQASHIQKVERTFSHSEHVPSDTCVVVEVPWRMHAKQVLTSDPFYSHYHGYKFQLEVGLMMENCHQRIIHKEELEVELSKRKQSYLEFQKTCQEGEKKYEEEKKNEIERCLNELERNLKERVKVYADKTKTIYPTNYRINVARYEENQRRSMEAEKRCIEYTTPDSLLEKRTKLDNKWVDLENMEKELQVFGCELTGPMRSKQFIQYTMVEEEEHKEKEEAGTEMGEEQECSGRKPKEVVEGDKDVSKSVIINTLRFICNNMVGVFFRLMYGDYDDYLQWPVEVRVQLELLNQAGDHHHLIKTRNLVLKKENRANESGSFLFVFDTSDFETDELNVVMGDYAMYLYLGQLQCRVKITIH